MLSSLQSLYLALVSLSCSSRGQRVVCVSSVYIEAADDWLGCT
jgi:hypothetical protein